MRGKPGSCLRFTCLFHTRPEGLGPLVFLQILGGLLHLRHLVWAGSSRLHGAHLPRRVSVIFALWREGSGSRALCRAVSSLVDQLCLAGWC